MYFNRCAGTLRIMVCSSGFSCFQGPKKGRFFDFVSRNIIKINKQQLRRFWQSNATSLLFKQHQSSGLTFVSSQDISVFCIFPIGSIWWTGPCVCTEPELAADLIEKTQPGSMFIRTQNVDEPAPFKWLTRLGFKEQTDSRSALCYPAPSKADQ